MQTHIGLELNPARQVRLVDLPGACVSSIINHVEFETLSVAAKLLDSGRPVQRGPVLPSLPSGWASDYRGPIRIPGRCLGSVITELSPPAVGFRLLTSGQKHSWRLS